MIIGKLMQGRAHLDYVAQIYRSDEVEVAPQPEDYALGTFVRVALPTPPGDWLVGLICDTTLLNPELDQVGPRLSTPANLMVFSPDYLQEKAVLVSIIMIGRISVVGRVSQKLPPVAVISDSPVELITPAQIQAFHGPPDDFSMAYLPHVLMDLKRPLALDVLALVLDQLEPLYPQSTLRQVFAIMIDDLRRQQQISPTGSGQ